MATIEKSTLKFLKDLEKNNNREWFKSQKDRYDIMHNNMIEFADDLMSLMLQHDQLIPMSGKQSLFRIYRDVRFSKDKSPYKNHMAGRMKRDTPYLRGGYYYSISPGGKSQLGCGFWNPNSEDLKLIRDQIIADHKPLMKILNGKKFKDTFGELHGEKLKNAPRGYDPEHPAVEILKHKSMYVNVNFTDKEVLSPGFAQTLNKHYKAIRPYLNYMSDILTHDLNGHALY